MTLFAAEYQYFVKKFMEINSHCICAQKLAKFIRQHPPPPQKKIQKKSKQTQNKQTQNKQSKRQTTAF